MAIPRFDGAAAWAMLSKPEKDEIGAAAIELVIASKAAFATEDLDPITHRASRAAGEKIVNLLDDAVATALTDRMAFKEPPVPSLVGDICERCGCTQEDACDGGCAWERPGLCTLCAPGRMAYAPPEIRKVRGLQS
jgi:hypothetical protein